MHTVRKKWKPIVLGIFLLLICIEVASLFLFKKAQTSAQAQTTKTDAKQLTTFTSTILKTCASSDPNMSHACYDREIPKLMDSPTNISMEDAFEVTKHIVEQDPTYAHCHVLGHKLSGKEMKKRSVKMERCYYSLPNRNVQ
jgi:hypothetical protein